MQPHRRRAVSHIASVGSRIAVMAWRKAHLSASRPSHFPASQSQYLGIVALNSGPAFRAIATSCIWIMGNPAFGSDILNSIEPPSAEAVSATVDRIKMSADHFGANGFLEASTTFKIDGYGHFLAPTHWGRAARFNSSRADRSSISNSRASI